MSEIIYVIVDKETGKIEYTSGPRRIPAHTSMGRAKAALKTHRIRESMYEIVEFTRKESVK